MVRKLSYGVPTDKCAITVRLGIEKGFFSDEGIDLDVQVVYGGPPLAAAYDSGQLQMGEIGSPPGVKAISEGARFRVVGGGLRRKAHMYFGFTKDIPVGNWNALAGKRVGLLSRGSCPEWFLRGILKSNGMDADRHLQFVGLLDSRRTAAAC